MKNVYLYFIITILLGSCENNQVLNGKIITRYPNGKIHTKDNWVDGKQEGWTTIYDSINSKIIEKFYYKHNIFYTHFKYSPTGCKYYYIRPYFPDNDDTLYISNNDSIPVQFFKDDNLVKIDTFVVNVKVIVKQKEETYQLFLYPLKQTSYITFHDKNWYIKGFKLSVYVQALNWSNNRLCCCDSIETALAQKYVCIK